MPVIRIVSRYVHNNDLAKKFGFRLNYITMNRMIDKDDLTATSERRSLYARVPNK